LVETKCASNALGGRLDDARREIAKEMSAHTTNIIKICENEYLVRHRIKNRQYFSHLFIKPEGIHRLKSKMVGDIDIFPSDLNDVAREYRPEGIDIPYGGDVAYSRRSVPRLETSGGKYSAHWPSQEGL